MLARRHNSFASIQGLSGEEGSKAARKTGREARIVEALRLLGDRGFSARLDLKKLRGYRGQYRLRAGRHRVLFELQPGKSIIVHAILPRRRAYRS